MKGEDHDCGTVGLWHRRHSHSRVPGRHRERFPAAHGHDWRLWRQVPATASVYDLPSAGERERVGRVPTAGAPLGDHTASSDQPGEATNGDERDPPRRASHHQDLPTIGRAGKKRQRRRNRFLTLLDRIHEDEEAGLLRDLSWSQAPVAHRVAEPGSGYRRKWSARDASSGVSASACICQEGVDSSARGPAGRAVRTRTEESRRHLGVSHGRASASPDRSQVGRTASRPNADGDLFSCC